MTTPEKAINAPKNENILRHRSAIARENFLVLIIFYKYALFSFAATGVSYMLL